MTWSNLHLWGSLAGLALVTLIVLSGFVPASSPRGNVPASVRANPASYHPVYVPTYRGGGGSSGGGWSGGK